MSGIMIRTKIVATVGPATGKLETVRRLVDAGCDVFRINFSHGSQEQRLEFLRNIRTVESETGAPLAVMGDLCGPKIRVGPIAGGSVLLVSGSVLTVTREPVEGTVERISTTLPEMVDEVDVGDPILLDDGKIRLEVAGTNPPEEFTCRVVTGGVLAGGKGVNLPRTKLRLSAMTEKDRQDASWIATRDFDYVALSFVRRADDVSVLRKLLEDAGCDAHIVAKIEKPQALSTIDEIIDAADVIMIARGDLGVEMDLPAVPVAQKRVAQLCRKAGKPCIIATQMLESMTHSPTPTRAEVSDVANAVLDHADAVMLSGETAVGDYPVEAVAMMNRIVSQIQSYHDEIYAPTHIAYAAARTAAALADAVREIVASENIAAVAVFTVSGTTALMFAKSRLPCPVLALSPDERAVRRMKLYYGVEPAHAGIVEHTREVLATASRLAVEKEIAKPGDRMVVVTGRPLGQSGCTNTLVVHTVGTST